MQTEDLISILPEIIITLVAAAVLMVDAFGGRKTHRGLMGLIVAGSVAAILVCVVLRADGGTAFGGMVLTDGYAVFFKVLFIAIAALSIVLAYAQSSDIPFAELAALILFATVGMLLLGATGDLITLYLGVELTSIPVYVLVAIKRDRFRATEGALKYFLLGAFASGVLLYGIAWLFGLTGTTNLADIALYVQSQGADNPWFLLGLGLLLVGLAFKVAAVPFHMWTPDAYQGAPTPSTAFLAAGAKIGAMAGLLRVVVHGLEPWQDMVLPVVIAIAVASMIVGNLVAIWQQDVKRLLAYSSIAHTGYMLVGIAVVHAESEAGGLMRDAVAAVMFYAVVYALMTLGAFAVTFAVERRTGGTDLENFQNLGRSSPLMAVAMAVFMISLTGIPPAAGFFGKLYLLQVAVNGGLTWVAVVLVLTSTVSAYYYLRVVVNMYMVDIQPRLLPVPHSTAIGAVVAVGMIGTLVLGVYPAGAVEWAQAAFEEAGKLAISP